MIHAYDELYLNDAMQNLGEAFSFASAVCKMDLDDFTALFLASGIADEFGRGNPKYVSGLSGTELVLEVLRTLGTPQEGINAEVEYDCSPEYWCGWILAYYQWFTRRPFKNILRCVTMQELLQLYPTLHEASELKFVETVNAMIRDKNLPTFLQQQRKVCGLTQKELSEKSGVNLRTLQQYELRSKDINKAAAETLLALAQVLSCPMEELLEYELQ